MSCPPPYNYRPSIPPAKNAAAPTYAEHRSRLFAGGTYFRSIDQGQKENRISLQLQDNVDFGSGADPNNFRLTVRYDGTPVETYDITQIVNMMDGSGDGIGKLRAATASSEYIEMYPRGADLAYDVTPGNPPIPGGDNIILTSFVQTYMSGGSGVPEDGSLIARINTGPERTMAIITSSEKQNGISDDPLPHRRVQQWNGDVWISYSNLIQGQCPI